MSNPNSNNSPNRIQLKVVPPAATPKVESIPDEIELKNDSKSPIQNPILSDNLPQKPTKSAPSFNYGRLLLIAGLIAGGVWVAQIPIPNSVRTEAKLEPSQDRHRLVYMGIPGTVTKFFVKSGDAVELDEPLAAISAVDLESEIIQKTAKLQEQESAKAAATVRIPIAQSKVEEAINQSAAAQRKVEELRQDIEGISKGKQTPEIEKLQAEIKALNSRIPGIEAEIFSLRSNLQQVETSIASYERPEFKIVMARQDLQDKLTGFKTQKSTIQGQIGSKEQEIQAIKHQVEAKFDEIAAVDELVALIEVAQSDSDLVKEMLRKPSATVVLQPLEPGLKPITTKIEKIEPVLQTDPSGQKQLLRVRAIVDNKDRIFQPNAKFYAQIEVESIPLYQRVQRELMKLFQIRKYV